MKIKTTKKAMRNGYNKIIGASYCSMQYLLKYQSPIAYSTRVEGWACDYYNIDGILISEGYSPLNNKNTNPDYDILREYENKARDINNNYSMNWELRREYINILLMDYIREVLI